MDRGVRGVLGHPGKDAIPPWAEISKDGSLHSPWETQDADNSLLSTEGYGAARGYT